jgi:hypothetical protein
MEEVRIHVCMHILRVTLFVRASSRHDAYAKKKCFIGYSRQKILLQQGDISLYGDDFF